ncbi:cytochrome c biogenesis protein DipZ [Aquabacterium sp. CECT 9606]|uniref:cytochrome c biogenesis protein DipZ n=1 Tax=Aquabacterium sp. CECT 9606 TaxID=2845822 RepID=UPI001E597FA1|nr:cytochrome c biogenesis protein DipZ [Aquabacterium sp. CECT 9606]CAH0348251.1 Protein DipZ [Aquabacterium sp. CECT 9606]
MMAASSWPLAFAGLAGVATVASPCVLPVLPVLLGVSASGADRARPIFIIIGFVLSFAAVALLFGASTRVLGLTPESVRVVAACGMLLAGVLMVWPALGERVMAPLGRVANVAQGWGGQSTHPPLGGLLLGATLGVLWTPCAGPVLASVLALVASQASTQQTAPLLLSYAAGAGLPMLAIAYGGQAMTHKVRFFSRHAARFRQGCGVLVVFSALAMAGQLDAQASAWLSQAWSSQVEPTPATHQAASNAPEFTGIHQWLNSPPLSMKGLRGKVVMVDFWTHACVNCVRTLPHVQRWHERYAAQGLVVVGVHTPEFAFERSTDSVQQAIRRHGLTYPVAQDNRYQTWNAYGNRYWPAIYLVDRQGRIVFTHFGEGDEAAIEQRIQKLLAAP